MKSEVTEVAIVGAGLVGSACALALAKRSTRPIHITLLESRAVDASDATQTPLDKGLDAFDTRVVALNTASRHLLEELGVWSAVEAYACPYTRMLVWDGEGSARVAFDCAEFQTPDLGHIVENRHLREALLEAVAASERISLHSPARMAALSQSAEHVCFELNGEYREASLLVGADGATSATRQSLGLDTREWAYGQRAITATIRCAEPHGGVARQWFSATGPLAFLPLRDPQTNDSSASTLISVVWSQDSGRAAELLELDDAVFCAALNVASEHVLGEVVEVSSRAAVTLAQRHAVDYISGRGVLIGDAAHAIHPLAGQGVNLGFADVATLSREIADALEQGIDPANPQVLARYQRRRKPENLAMMAAMEGFKQLFARDEWPLRVLRNQGMRIFDRAAPLKNAVMRRALGLDNGPSSDHHSGPTP